MDRDWSSHPALTAYPPTLRDQDRGRCATDPHAEEPSLPARLSRYQPTPTPTLTKNPSVPNSRSATSLRVTRTSLGGLCGRTESPSQILVARSSHQTRNLHSTLPLLSASPPSKDKEHVLSRKKTSPNAPRGRDLLKLNVHALLLDTDLETRGNRPTVTLQRSSSPRRIWRQPKPSITL